MPEKRSLRQRIRADIEKNRQRIKKLGPGLITGGAGTTRREGMDNRVSDAKGFYLVFVGALFVGALFVGAGINLAEGINVVDALYYSQVLDGILIPVLILIAWMISNNHRIMGSHVFGRFENIFALLAFVVTATLSAFMIRQWIS